MTHWPKENARHRAIARKFVLIELPRIHSIQIRATRASAPELSVGAPARRMLSRREILAHASSSPGLLHTERGLISEKKNRFAALGTTIYAKRVTHRYRLCVFCEREQSVCAALRRPSLAERKSSRESWPAKENEKAIGRRTT